MKKKPWLVFYAEKKEVWYIPHAETYDDALEAFMMVVTTDGDDCNFVELPTDTDEPTKVEDLLDS